MYNFVLDPSSDVVGAESETAKSLNRYQDAVPGGLRIERIG